MKKNACLKGILVLSLLTLWSSCSSDDDELEDKMTAAGVEAAVKNGEWRITYYFDSDKEETSDYLGYVFIFNADGTLGATDGNTSVSGAWSITDSDNSNDDSSESDIDFNIFFASPDIFEELSDNWDIQKFTSTKIELFDLSGGDGTTDYLTFERN